ncbi:MAG TPA: zf-TFIIB domain-containing protein [Kofleriaceae bacterium]|nr:zf-TFIIB domain-containing protein [Kofleriaceae bacterium]
MSSPYREPPRYLLCPRCGELLTRALEGVSSCVRCEGLWIAPATLDAAFGNPRWPVGQTLWWRSTLDCPECAFEGKQTLMTARMANDVLVDQCPDHGLWLDRGELARLMGAAVDDLAALRARLAVVAPDLDKLVARREQWRADLEARRQASAAYRQAIADEHRRQRAIEQVAAPSEATQRRAARAAERTLAAHEVARLHAELATLDAQVQRLEHELAATRQRAAEAQRELDAARGKLAADDE